MGETTMLQGETMGETPMPLWSPGGFAKASLDAIMKTRYASLGNDARTGGRLGDPSLPDAATHAGNTGCHRDATGRDVSPKRPQLPATAYSSQKKHSLPFTLQQIKHAQQNRKTLFSERFFQLHVRPCFGSVATHTTTY